MTNPIRLVQFTNCFHVGGGEMQFLELLRRLPSGYDVSVHALDPRGPLLAETRALGYEPHIHPLHGSLMRPATVTETARLSWWLRRERIDLVHAQDFYSTLLGVPAAKFAGVPIVVSRLDLVHWHGTVRHVALAAASHAADVVIANCEAVKRFVVERERIPAARVCVIRNGLDVERFDAAMRAPLLGPLPDTGSAAVAVLVANMRHEVKRQEDFLTALAKVRRDGADVVGFLVGEGARRGVLETMARDLGLERAAFFLGGRKDVPAILARGTFGVLCSKQEGLSNAVMEGMAASLPMLVTDAGGNAELVLDGERGWVVPPERPDALARAMTRILEDPARAKRMGATARRFVEEELTLARMIAEHDRLYRQVARGARGLDAAA
ncbi:MAG: glycosyltransferase [Anaeromyxobacteraceae bacterium]